ncbi:4-hydroxy-3-methylbut-2-enyl diphosphate reductase [Phragmitibacter flavus]|uniref:4-hydroxy-3-methylbut-2-enyl diphosphate reductase n=1 Tax=Phragmitibacter flavus TaxID=2576071 RepID=A0A5R8KIS1_9BACT|nr:4-hydroxy-3-methylbut-2-enyl diphosphate reductase [Phragmitibacter flavus]TLD71855.1 4-hydroxy-3-methylbut-2-enyl diphosphate reductase [Phragmitibacter flavus]
MKIHLATHFGMCFGVRAALRSTHEVAKSGPVTLLGQLVHNPLVEEHMRSLGVRQGELDRVGQSESRRVVISAHGAADRQREAWKVAGFEVTDTTCPLVRKAHQALEGLVREGYFPVIVGQAGHVEVRGLRGDFPGAMVVLDEMDVEGLPFQKHFGVVAQTTQPLMKVLRLVEVLKCRHPESEVRFVDTVCRPTKQRQSALEELCGRCDTMVVIGGRNSNNTKQLAETARERGLKVWQVERAEELEGEWFVRSREVGVTAGTSTLDETVRAVMDRLQRFAAEAGAAN